MRDTMGKRGFGNAPRVEVAAQRPSAWRVWALAAAVTLVAWFGLSRLVFAGEGADPKADLAVAKALSNAYASVAESVLPSVVSIRSQKNFNVPSGDGDEGDAARGDIEDEASELFRAIPELREFFRSGPGGGPERRLIPRGGRGFPRGLAPRHRSEGIGTGVIYDKEGRILTNYHVVSDADKLIVQFHDETEMEAEVLASDPETELAIIKLKKTPPGLKPAKIGDSGKLRIGEIVLAIGSPFRHVNSVTSGIVSATGRKLGVASFEDYIQTDASINPGNSGGPLVNLDGEVVGINTLINTTIGGSVGVGFAIPSGLFQDVTRQLLEFGSVKRGYLGVTLNTPLPEVMEDLRASKGLTNEDGGALVGAVTEGMPGAKAGLKEGDIILQFNDTPVKNSQHLMEMVAACRPGEIVELQVIRRNGERETLSATLAERPSADKLNELLGGGLRVAPSAPEARKEEVKLHEDKRLGLTVAELTDPRRARLEIPKEVKGVVVQRVRGAATDVFRPGMVIQEVGKDPIETLDEFKAAVDALDAGEPAAFWVWQKEGGNRYVTMRVPKRDTDE